MLQPLYSTSIQKVFETSSSNFYTIDLWVFGKNGVYRTTQEYSLPIGKEPIVGLRELLPADYYYSSRTGNINLSLHWSDALELGQVNLDEIKKHGIETDPKKIKLSIEFRKEDFKEIAYKKLLRDPSKYANEVIRIEGSILQIIDSSQAIILDKDSNAYYLQIEIDTKTKLLEDDTVIVYGLVNSETYKYKNLFGSQKEVPSVFVRIIELLEDE